MAVKTIGSAWKKFYADKDFWPEGAYHDDEEMTVNGASVASDYDLSLVGDNDVVTISGGGVFDLGDGKEEPSLELHFKRWLKKQTVFFGTFECPKELESAVKAAIISAGGKV